MPRGALFFVFWYKYSTRIKNTHTEPKNQQLKKSQKNKNNC